MEGLKDRAGWLRQARFHVSGSRGKARCELGWNWHPAPLSDFDLWYAVSGSGEMRISDATYPIRKGSCFLVRPGDRPMAEQDPHHLLRVIFIHFNCHPLEFPDSKTALLPPRFTCILDTFHFEMLLNRILELDHAYSAYNAEEFDLIMKQLFIQLYREQDRQRIDALEDRHHRLMMRIVSQLKEDPGHEIGLEELAEKAGLSPSYFSKVFKQVTGDSLKRYKTKLRLQRALHLLQETSMNVSQVAHALGYANVYYFSNQFKRHYGYPPSHFQYKGVAHQSHGKRQRHDLPYRV